MMTRKCERYLKAATFWISWYTIPHIDQVAKLWARQTGSKLQAQQAGRQARQAGRHGRQARAAGTAGRQAGRQAGGHGRQAR